MLGHMYPTLEEAVSSQLSAISGKLLAESGQLALRGRHFEPQPRRRGPDRVRRRFSGDHIRKVTPVPIPNTAVKLSEPMVVPKVRE